MILDIEALTVDQLNAKANELSGKMKQLEMAGSHGSNAYAQCIFWMHQITFEIEERMFMTEIEDSPDWKSGLVATIGEDHLEKDKDDGKKK